MARKGAAEDGPRGRPASTKRGTEEPGPVPERKRKVVSTREGRKVFIVYVTHEQHRALRIIAAKTDRTLAQVGIDMVDAYIAANGDDAD